MKTEQEAEKALEKYANTVRKICFMHLKKQHDVEDVFQDVFLKYVLYQKPFESDVHEKAWLIRVTINSCKDLLKSFFRSKVSSLNDVNVKDFSIDESEYNLLDMILRLPDNYKNTVYLFYYEGYSAVEIAKILNKNENTIYTWLSRAKKKLKEELVGDTFEQ